MRVYIPPVLRIERGGIPAVDISHLSRISLHLPLKKT
jgi:hypothetical protein